MIRSKLSRFKYLLNSYFIDHLTKTLSNGTFKGITNQGKFKGITFLSSFMFLSRLGQKHPHSQCKHTDRPSETLGTSAGS